SAQTHRAGAANNQNEESTPILSPIRSRPESPSLAASAWQRIDWWIGVGLLLMVMAVYWPTLQFDFVNWDDPWYVVRNPLLRSWHPSNLADVATQSVARNYAPATILSFLVDYSLWELNPGGYHLTNLLLHGVNAVLVYVLIRQLSGSRFVSLLTAALFAVHPV